MKGKGKGIEEKDGKEKGGKGRVGKTREGNGLRKREEKGLGKGRKGN